MHLVCNADIRYDLSQLECKQEQEYAKSTFVILYIVYHDDASFSEVQHLADKNIFRFIKIPQTRYDEMIIFTNPIKKYLTFDAEFCGMLIYSFNKKGFNFDFEMILKQNQEADVFVFQWGNPSTDIFYDLLIHHGLPALQLFKHIIVKMGLDPRAYVGVVPVWKNSWIARSNIFQQYCQFMNSVIKLLETDLDCMTYANANSGYSRNYPTTKLLQVYKHPFHTLHGFVLERLPALFFKKLGLNVKYVFRTQ